MISIVIDTNLLKSGSTDFTCVQFVDKVKDIIDELESNDLYDSVQVLIPKIVIDELYTHQIRSHSEKYSAIKSCKFPNFKVVPCDDYREVLLEKFDIAIQELALRDAKCLVIPYPQNEILPNIISRALSKQPPFEGKDKESDKGFKDVLIWESIITYKKEHLSDTIILCSRDGRLCDRTLADEFRTLFNDDIHLIKLDASSNRPIYDKIAELTGSNLKLTLSDRLKQDVLELITEDRLRLLFIDEYFESSTGTQYCDGIAVTKTSIQRIGDAMNDENRASITANAIIEIQYTDSDMGASSEPSEFQFDIEYSFIDHQFYLIGYESLNGYVDIRERNFTLE